MRLKFCGSRDGGYAFILQEDNGKDLFVLPVDSCSINWEEHNSNKTWKLEEL